MCVMCFCKDAVHSSRKLMMKLFISPEDHSKEEDRKILERHLLAYTATYTIVCIHRAYRERKETPKNILRRRHFSFVKYVKWK